MAAMTPSFPLALYNLSSIPLSSLISPHHRIAVLAKPDSSNLTFFVPFPSVSALQITHCCKCIFELVGTY